MVTTRDKPRAERSERRILERAYAVHEHSSRPSVTALLANGDFAWVLGAVAAFSASRWLETLAVGVFVIDLTGSVAAVAVVGAFKPWCVGKSQVSADDQVEPVA